MAAGNPKGEIDLLHDDAGIAVRGPQRQRMKGKPRKPSKDPFKITVILSICKKNPLNVIRILRHGEQDFPQVGFGSADLSRNEKECINPDSDWVTPFYGKQP